nr:proline-rich nuclear receptor coactivator 2 isoform X1 [Caretta caretta]
MKSPFHGHCGPPPRAALSPRCFLPDILLSEAIQTYSNSSSNLPTLPPFPLSNWLLLLLLAGAGPHRAPIGQSRERGRVVAGGIQRRKAAAILCGWRRQRAQQRRSRGPGCALRGSECGEAGGEAAGGSGGSGSRRLGVWERVRRTEVA